MIVAGLGSRREVDADQLEAAINHALDQHHLRIEEVGALATESAKAEEPAFIELARRLCLTIVACSTDDLKRASGQVLTSSKAALEAKGVPSIAEASALVAAGRNARLLSRRVTTPGATCALAIGDGP
jgi:cobalt-precorrin 5A hydrolase